MTQRLFGTDGIRGAAGKFPLDGPTVTRIGAALVRSLGQERSRKIDCYRSRYARVKSMD